MHHQISEGRSNFPYVTSLLIQREPNQTIGKSTWTWKMTRLRLENCEIRVLDARFLLSSKINLAAIELGNV